MRHLLEHYLDGTTSNIMTRGVLLGFQRKRPNQGAVLLTQKEYKKTINALLARCQFDLGDLREIGIL